MKRTNDLTIAFLGAGRMGAPMASRLISNGFNVRVWNRSVNASVVWSNWEGSWLRRRRKRHAVPTS